MYGQLIGLDGRAVLPWPNQLDIANQLTSLGRYVESAEAYEKLVRHYPTAPDVDQIHLLLGLIYARHLNQDAAAEPHLRSALTGIKNPNQRAQCLDWLTRLEQRRDQP